MSPTQNKIETKEEADRKAKIAELQKAVERAEGRGQKETSYHELLERMKNPPKETKGEIKDA